MLRRSLLILLGTLTLAGCSSTSFVGRRVDNFTAYYNTFYNAKKVYGEGVKALDQQDQPVDRTQYLPIFTTADRAGNPQDFEAAIKKSADVLRDHPDSKWVDDALLLIGKSYFYTQNYVGAEQKFREVIEVESELSDEARFWLARTLIASGAYEEALQHLELTLNRESLSDRWRPKLQLALGELYVKRADWEEAASVLADGLEDLDDNDLGNRAQYLLAQVYETMGRYEDAARAYDRVRKFAPPYELAYAAQYSATRVRGLHLDSEEALSRLRKMERDDKHYAYRNELSLLRGQIYHAAGQPYDALEVYDRLLYDNDGNIADVRSRAHYALADLYRDAFEDYLYAAAHYDTASTGLGGARGGRPGGRGGRSAGASAADDVLRSPEAITDAGERAEVFGTFASVFDEIVRMDSLLHLGSLDEEAFQEKVLELRQQKAEEQAEARRRLEEQQIQQQFQNQGATFADNTAAPGASASAGTEAGFLFHRDPVRVQEGQLNFVERWGSRPLVPNWRRLDAIDRGQAEAGDEDLADVGLPGFNPEAPGTSALPTVDLTDIPRDSLSRTTMRARRAAARYELANVLFLSIERPDSAAVWYRRVLEEDPDEEVAQRAFYALAEVQRALGDERAARDLYERVIETYPDSELAERVREQLGMTAPSMVEDSTALAARAYDRAYQDWHRGLYHGAMNDMLRLAVSYASTPVAPQALLAAASIYTEWAVRDSLDLFAELPLSVPDSVLLASDLLPQVQPVSAEALEETPEAPAQPPVAGEAQRLPEEPAVADSARQVPADTMRVARLTPSADSLAGSEQQPDRAPEEAAVRADSIRAASVPDSLAKPVALDAADSTAAALPSTLVSLSVPTDTVTVEPELEPVRLETLYASIVRHYPQSPYADRARRLMRALDERRPVQEGLAADSAATDSLAVPGDSTALMRDRGPVADQPAPADSLADPTDREAFLKSLRERREAIQLSGEERAPGDSSAAPVVPDTSRAPGPERRLPTPPTDTTKVRADSSSVAVPPAAKRARGRDLFMRRAASASQRADTTAASGDSTSVKRNLPTPPPDTTGTRRR